jgi:hypothetical protein
VRLACYIPVGPGDDEVRRVVDLIDSVKSYCSKVEWIILVDDPAEPRTLAPMITVPAGVQLTVLLNPRDRRGPGNTGGLCVADMIAFQHVQQSTDAEYLLKLDTDSLVISQFTTRVEPILRNAVDLGMLGVIGDSFGDNRRYDYVRENRSLLMRILDLPDNLAQVDFSNYPELRWFGLADQERCSVIRSYIRRALQFNAVIGEYCQGGAYIVSRRLLDEMGNNGYFRSPTRWGKLKLGEDVFVSLCCVSLGLRLYDSSYKGSAFAIHPHCLPLTCEELIALDRSIIHSIKGNKEELFRDYFRTHRRAQTIRPHSSLEDLPPELLRNPSGFSNEHNVRENLPLATQ